MNDEITDKCLHFIYLYRFNAESSPEKSSFNSRRGPQNAGLESNPEATAARKDRPQ